MTLETLPQEIAGQIFDMLGFHRRPVASVVSKSWYAMDSLASSRARHRASLDARGNGEEFFALGVCARRRIPMHFGSNKLLEVLGRDSDLAAIYPHRTGPRYTRTSDVVAQLEALRALRVGARRGTVDAGPARLHAAERGADIRAPALPDLLVLRTNTNQCFRGAHVVVIEKCTGKVLVYKHPRDVAPHSLPLEDIAVEDLELRKRYEATGLFLGLSKLYHNEGRTMMRWGDTILLQLPATMDGANRLEYHYVYIGLGSIFEFGPLPEPVTRYYSNVGNNHAIYPIAITATDAIFFKAYGKPVRISRDDLLREPRCLTGGRTNEEIVTEFGECGWELMMLRTGGPMWGYAGGVHILRACDQNGATGFPTVAQEPPMASLTQDQFAEVMRRMAERFGHG